MKEYNRKTKKWEEKSTEKIGDIKKKIMCKGGNAHKMRLVLPDYIMRINRDLTEEMVLAWYESKDRIYEFSKEEFLKIEKLGLTERMWNYKPSKQFECEICGKKNYEM